MAEQGVSHWMLACWLLLLCLSEVLPAAPESSRNYYDTLNVEKTATDSQIKKAFRLLAVKYHPDKNKSADAEKAFREVAEAYKVLSNKEKRMLYDRFGHEAFVKNEASGPEFSHESGFPFGFEEPFFDFDESPFVEDPFMWSSHQDAEEMNDPFEHYSSAEPGFGFIFVDEDEDDHFSFI